MLALDKGSVVVVGSVVMGLTEATVLFAFLTLCSSLILEKEPTLKLRTSGLVGSNAFGRSVLAAGDGRTRARISRYKRASQSCGLGNNTLLEISPYDLSEKAEAIQAVWVGRDEFVVVASDKVATGRSTIWRATPTAYGIFRFKSDSYSISSSVMPDTLQVSPAGNMATVVVVSLDKMYVYVSRNFGQTWDRFNSPTTNFDPSKELYLSTFNPLNMVIRSRAGELYVSSNAGRSWSFITRNVQLVEFAEGNQSSDLMYYSTTSKSLRFNPLYRMDITNRHTTVIDNSAYRFRVDDHYLFVSRKNATGNKVADSKSRRLYVSSDYNSSEVHFMEVQLPSLQDEQYYVVMGTHEFGAFIHVYQGSVGDNYGNLYISDSTGARFSLSLPNHLYQVYRAGLGHYSIHDFYEVKSIRGVYITTQVHPESKGQHVTMITFNGGAKWSVLTPPSGSSCSGCSLHLHLRYSQVVAPFYNGTASKGILSVERAPLIILAHGMVGLERSYDGLNTKVYLSSDGGYTWKDVGLPVGTYVYGIADYGNIIAIAPDSDHVERIWFSHDRGGCFVERSVDTTGVFQLNRGLVFDPSAASLYGFLMGVEGTGQDDEWRIITLNFKSLLNTPCGGRDYQQVVEHANSSTCLMGYKLSFKLAKPSSICYNPEDYDYHPQKVRCPCNYSDYECNYGFVRKKDTVCERDPAFPLSDVCPPGTNTYLQSDSGFVLIPGDNCVHTDDSNSLLSQTSHQCTGHEQDSGYRPHHRNVGLTVFLVILIIALSLVLASIVLFVWLRCRSKTSSIRDRVYYQRLPQDDKHKFDRNDESSSDEDLISAT